MTRSAARIVVTGLVQGVGFRPYVHRLAAGHGLDGWVRNTAGHVEIHVEGAADAIDAFRDALTRRPPVLARVARVEFARALVSGEVGFVVKASVGGTGRQPVSPDVATCEACLRELRDPTDRRYRYPFITCTDCGPRFTVIEAMPYDRERTSMRAFSQCPSCLEEYTTPGSRRFHSETNSCPGCGPRLWFAGATGESRFVEGDDAIRMAAALIRDGGIVALKGLGGFQLAADATNDQAVRRLRERKAREAKPLAVMVASIDEAARLGAIGNDDAAILTSAARPVVLVRKLDNGALSDAVAPGLLHLGIMLPSTPLHYLMTEAAGRALVMTSGNHSEEPIATGNDEARARLEGIADGFLLHDREIVARYDDSVVRVVEGAPVFLRRARGYAPLAIEIPVESPHPLLAVGPHLKNTFTLLTARSAHVSQHIGDLDNLETVTHFQESLRRFEELFSIRPEFVVRDLHPGYLSTRLAAECGLPVAAAVQHHHAHVAAVMAEHGRTDPVIGVAYDGTGYGHDGAVWGSEVLVADLVAYRRLAHLRYAPLPGGDAAARSPWRSAVGYLSTVPEAAEALGRATAGIPVQQVDMVRRQLERRINSPMASSMGRLFDAAAAVLGLRSTSRYEGEAAMVLEAASGETHGTVLPFVIASREDGIHELDPVPTLVMLAERLIAGDAVPSLAASFHDTIVHATAELVRHAVADTGYRTVVLGGGCFQNARLLAGLKHRLEHDGCEVLVPRLAGPNDGAVSLGQAAVGAAVLAGWESKAGASAAATATGG